MERIGKYLIIEKIATGGMSNVYKVKHPTLDSYMILKQLNIKGVEGVVERFKREARIMFNFRSENIVQVYDHFKEGTSYYIVMEYIDGMGLDKVIQAKRHLTTEAAVLILFEICKGLKYAHDKGVIHRDIKPANIMVSKEGEIKLTDFGIAKSEEDAPDGLTLKGTTLGTPSYMAPEQIADSKDVDKRADIFSLGVLFYQSLTGKLPFASDIPAKTIALIEKGRYKKPRRINPRIPPKIQTIITKMIRKKARSRFKDLGFVLERLSPYLKQYKTQQQKNDDIRDYIFGDEKSFSFKRIQKSGAFYFRIIALVFLISGILGYYFYHKGLYHDLLVRGSYGKISLKITLDKSIRKYNPDIIKATLFSKDKNGNFRETGSLNCRLATNRNYKSEEFIHYLSDDIYLKADDYILSSDIIDEKFYREFKVEPMTGEESFKFPARAKEIELLYTEPPELPLDIRYYFYDKTDETRIGDVAIYLYDRNDWVKWEIYRDKRKDALLTDKTYYFKFEKEGYLTKRLNISVNRSETVLKLFVYLVPIQ